MSELSIVFKNILDVVNELDVSVKVFEFGGNINE